MKLRFGRAFALGMVALLTGNGLAAPSRMTLYTTVHPAMGTSFTLYLYSADSTQAASVSQEVFEEVDRVEDLLSNYRESSELSRINRSAFPGPVTTDAETFDFLTQSQHWSQASDGAFDITVGRLMRAWGFFRSSGRVPTPEELQQLRTVTGWQNIELDPGARAVSFKAAGMELDPGGIGKGFAVDAAVRILRARQVPAAMLSAGNSTIYALGAPPHSKGWRVVVPGPLPSHRTLTIAILRDTSLSSADCSEKNFTLDGHLYCHIMNPQTMRPVEGRIQVSIIDRSATASDALSNVLFVDTPAQSAAFLKTYAPAARALIVSGDALHPHCNVVRWNAAVASSHCML